MNKLTKLVDQLTKAFDPENVHIRTQHHIQVTCGYRISENQNKEKIKSPNYHNIWLAKNNQLKYIQYGENGSSKEAESIEQLIEQLQKYSHKNTDLARAKEAVDLARILRQAQDFHTKENLDKAWYVDAGWKNGLATIGAVYIKRTEYGTDVTAHSWTIPADNSSNAEYKAIRRAHSRIHNIPIYSDSQSMVKKAQSEGLDAYWIPRSYNLVADSIGNRRNVSSNY